MNDRGTKQRAARAAVRAAASSAAFAALLALPSIGAAPVAQESPPPPAAAPAAAPPIDAQRAARLASDRARCEAVAAGVERFGHIDEFTAAARTLLSKVTERFVDVGDGVFTDSGLEYWLDWNVRRDGGPVLPKLDTESTTHPYRAILDLDRQLRARGIDFLLVTFPTRPALYPELAMEFPSMEGFAGMCPATPPFLEALIDQGVEALYLAPEFVAQRYGKDGDKGDQLFLRYNQHWSPRGAEMAARLIAERLARYPWFEPGPAKEGKDWTLKAKAIDVNVVWGGTPEGSKPERCQCTQVLPPPGRRRVDSVRPSSPIVLLSGSFADFHGVTFCDFTSQLFRHTGWAIDKVNPKGGVEDSCRLALAEKSEADWKKKKIVIWMVAEQAFRTGPMWRPIPIFGQ